MGLTLESLSAHTVDEAGKEAFVTQDPLKLLRKARAGHGVSTSIPYNLNSERVCQSFLRSHARLGKRPA